VTTSVYQRFVLYCAFGGTRYISRNCDLTPVFSADADNVIAERLRFAQDEGQLSQWLGPQALARVVVSIMRSVATRARVGATRNELSTLAEGFVTALFPA